MDNKQEVLKTEVSKPEAPKKKLPVPANTLFLVPEPDYDQRVVKAALKERYEPISHHAIASKFNMQAAPHIPDFAIIVCKRVVEDPRMSPGSRTERDPHTGEFREFVIAPETYVHEVVLSKPLKISEFITLSEAGWMAARQIDISPFINAVSEAAHPYRVLPENPPDFMCRMMGVS